ncbi:MAG: DUF1269 domain-containing protein [Candidatus Brachytrichaceae bacterium NZ_4S206]|jgi:uncharacterized membrane protein
MSRITVITFDNTKEADQVRDALRDLSKRGLLTIMDSAVVVKDAQGEVKVNNQLGRNVKWGLIGGGILGGLLFFLFPVAGIVGGAAAGAVIGKSLGDDVDKKFIEEVKQALQPGTSALFIITRDEHADAVFNALKPFKGTVYHTSLSPTNEETLKRVLSERA